MPQTKILAQVKSFGYKLHTFQASRLVLNRKKYGYKINLLLGIVDISLKIHLIKRLVFFLVFPSIFLLLNVEQISINFANSFVIFITKKSKTVVPIILLQNKKHRNFHFGAVTQILLLILFSYSWFKNYSKDHKWNHKFAANRSCCLLGEVNKYNRQFSFL